MTNPRITIVTPSYNQAAYLEETIESVLSQGYPNLEYIVIDGGSTDGSLEIIRRHASQLAFWVSEPDGGQTAGLNKGFSRATGEILGFLNSDDVYRPGALAAVADAYHRTKRKAAFWHAFSVEDFDASGPRNIVRPRPVNRLADWVDYVAYLHQPGVFWLRELHTEVGGFDESYHYAFDRKFFAMAVRKGHRLTVDPEFVSTRFRLHAASKTVTVGSQNNEMGFADEFIRVLRDVMREAGVATRARIALGRIERRLEDRSQACLNANPNNRVTRLGCLALAGLLYPPHATTRFYWGALRRALLPLGQETGAAQ